MSSNANLVSADPQLCDQIVSQLKSQGIFDQFRKECLSDVDTKPAYQTLHDQVNAYARKFLSTQRWTPELNKNQLRESLRKYIGESSFLESGVERIVDQVVDPKIEPHLIPKVEDLVYKIMGIEKPSESEEEDQTRAASDCDSEMKDAKRNEIIPMEESGEGYANGNGHREQFEGMDNGFKFDHSAHSSAKIEMSGECNIGTEQLEKRDSFRDDLSDISDDFLPTDEPEPIYSLRPPSSEPEPIYALRPPSSEPEPIYALRPPSSEPEPIYALQPPSNEPAPPGVDGWDSPISDRDDSDHDSRYNDSNFATRDTDKESVRSHSDSESNDHNLDTTAQSVSSLESTNQDISQDTSVESSSTSESSFESASQDSDPDATTESGVRPASKSESTHQNLDTCAESCTKSDTNFEITDLNLDATAKYSGTSDSSLDFTTDQNLVATEKFSESISKNTERNMDTNMELELNLENYSQNHNTNVESKSNFRCADQNLDSNAGPESNFKSSDQNLDTNMKFDVEMESNSEGSDQKRNTNFKSRVESESNLKSSGPNLDANTKSSDESASNSESVHQNTYLNIESSFKSESHFTNSDQDANMKSCVASEPDDAAGTTFDRNIGTCEKLVSDFVADAKLDANAETESNFKSPDGTHDTNMNFDTNEESEDELKLSFGTSENLDDTNFKSDAELKSNFEITNCIDDTSMEKSESNFSASTEFDVNMGSGEDLVSNFNNTHQINDENMEQCVESNSGVNENLDADIKFCEESQSNFNSTIKTLQSNIKSCVELEMNLGTNKTSDVTMESGSESQSYFQSANVTGDKDVELCVKSESNSGTKDANVELCIKSELDFQGIDHTCDKNEESCAESVSKFSLASDDCVADENSTQALPMFSPQRYVSSDSNDSIMKSPIINEGKENADKSSSRTDQKNLVGLVSESNLKTTVTIGEMVAFDSGSSITAHNILATSDSDPVCNLMHSITIKDNGTQQVITKSELDTDQVQVSKAELDTDQVPVSKAELDTDQVQVSKAELDTEQVQMSKAELDTEQVQMTKAESDTDLESESLSKDMESEISISESGANLEIKNTLPAVEEEFNSEISKTSTVPELAPTMAASVNESASPLNFPSEFPVAENNTSQYSDPSRVINIAPNNATNSVFSVFDPSGDDNLGGKIECGQNDIQNDEEDRSLFEFSPINDDWDDKMDTDSDSNTGISKKRNSITSPEKGFSIFDPSEPCDALSEKLDNKNLAKISKFDSVNKDGNIVEKSLSKTASTTKENQSDDGKHARDKESSRKSEGKKHRSSRRSRSPESKSSKHRKHRETSSERRRRKKKKRKDSRCRDVSPGEHRKHRRHSGDGGGGGSRSKGDHKSSSSSSKSKSSKSTSHGSRNENESSNSDAVSNLKSKGSEERKSHSKHGEKRNESIQKSNQNEMTSRFEFDMFAEKMKKVIVRPNRNNNPNKMRVSQIVEDSGEGSLSTSVGRDESKNEIIITSNTNENLAGATLVKENSISETLDGGDVSSFCSEESSKKVIDCDEKNEKCTNRNTFAKENKTSPEKPVDIKVSNSEDDEKSSPNKCGVDEVTCKHQIKESVREKNSYKSTDEYLLNVVLHDKFKSCCDTSSKSNENLDLKLISQGKKSCSKITYNEESSHEDSETNSDVEKKIEPEKIGIKVSKDSRMSLRRKSVASESVKKCDKREPQQIESKALQSQVSNDQADVSKDESKEDEKMELRRPSKIKKSNDSENSDKQKKGAQNLKNELKFQTRNLRTSRLASQNYEQNSSSDTSSDSDEERGLTKELKILLPKNIIENPADNKTNSPLQPSGICTRKRALSTTKIETGNISLSNKNKTSPPKKKNEIDETTLPIGKIQQNNTLISTKRIKTIPAKYKDDIDVTKKKESSRANKNNHHASDNNSSDGKKIKTSLSPPPSPPTKISTRFNGNNPSNKTNSPLPGNSFPAKRVRTLMPVTRNKTEMNPNNSVVKNDNQSIRVNFNTSKTVAPPKKGSPNKSKSELISAKNPTAKIEKVAVPGSLPITKALRISLSKVEDVKDKQEISPKTGIKTRSEKGVGGRTSTRSMGDTITKSPSIDNLKKLTNKPKTTPTKNLTEKNIPKKLPIASGTSTNISLKKISQQSKVILSNYKLGQNEKSEENVIDPSNEIKELSNRKVDPSNNIAVSDKPENLPTNKAIDLNNLNVINALDGKMIAYSQVNTQNGGQQPVVICLGYLQDDMIKSAFAQAGISFFNNMGTTQNPNPTVNIQDGSTAPTKETTPQNPTNSIKMQNAAKGDPATKILHTKNQSQSVKVKNSFTASLNDKLLSIVRNSVNNNGKSDKSSNISRKSDNLANMAGKSEKLANLAEKSDKLSNIAGEAASYDFESDNNESDYYKSQLLKVDKNQTADTADDPSHTSYLKEARKKTANDYSDSESGDSPIYHSFSSDSSDSDDSDDDDDIDDDMAKESDELDPSHIPNLFADSEENKFPFIQSVTDAGFDQFQERAMANMLNDSEEKEYVSESESVDSSEPKESEETDNIYSENEIDLIYDQKKEIQKIKLVNDRVSEIISVISKAANRLVSMYGRLQKEEKRILMDELSNNLTLLKEMKLFGRNMTINNKQFNSSVCVGNQSTKNKFQKTSNVTNENSIEEQIFKNFMDDDSVDLNVSQSTSRNLSSYDNRTKYHRESDVLSDHPQVKRKGTHVKRSTYAVQPVKSIFAENDEKCDYLELQDKPHGYSTHKQEIMMRTIASRGLPYSSQSDQRICTTVENNNGSSKVRSKLHSYTVRRPEVISNATTSIKDNYDSPESLNKLNYYGPRRNKIPINVSPVSESSYSAQPVKNICPDGQRNRASLELQQQSHSYSACQRMQPSPVREFLHSASINRNICTTSNRESPEELVHSKPINQNHPYSNVWSDEEFSRLTPVNKNLLIDDFASNRKSYPSMPARKNTQIVRNSSAPNNSLDSIHKSQNHGLHSARKLDPIKIIPYSPSSFEKRQTIESRNSGPASKSYQVKKCSNKIGDIWENLISADANNILLSRKIPKGKAVSYSHRGLRVPDELIGKPVEVLELWFEELKQYNDRFMEAIWDLDLNYMEGETGENNFENSSLTVDTSRSATISGTLHAKRELNDIHENIGESRTLRENPISSQNRTYKSKVSGSINIREDIITLDDEFAEGNMIHLDNNYIEEPITRAKNKLSSFTDKYQANENAGRKYFNKSQKAIQMSTQATKEKNCIPAKRSLPSDSLCLQTSFDHASATSSPDPSSELQNKRKRGRPSKSTPEKNIPKLSIPNFNKSAANLLKISQAQQGIGLLSSLNDPMGGDLSQAMASKNQFTPSILGLSCELEPTAKKQRFSSPNTNAKVSSFMSPPRNTPQSQNKIIFKKITKKSNAGLRGMPRILTEGIKAPRSSPSTTKLTNSSSKRDTAREADWNDSTSELIDLDPSQMPDLMAELDVQNADRQPRDKLYKRKDRSPEVEQWSESNEMYQPSSANGYKRVRKQKNILDL